MRGATISLIVFSALMGMASVGLTSAHPHEGSNGSDVSDSFNDTGALELEFAALDGLGAPPQTEPLVTSLDSDTDITANGLEELDVEWPYFGDSSEPSPKEAQSEPASREQIRETRRKEQGAKRQLERALKRERANSEADIENVRPEHNKRSDDEWGEETTVKVTIPTLTLDEIAASFEARLERHAKRFEESVETARGNNESRFSRFEDGFDINSGEDVREAARALEDIIAESGIISNIADMLVDITDDVEIGAEGGGMTFDFEGKRLGKITSSHEDGAQRYDIEGLGRFMTLIRENINKDGKDRLRFTIEFDENIYEPGADESDFEP